MMGNYQGFHTKTKSQKEKHSSNNIQNKAEAVLLQNMSNTESEEWDVSEDLDSHNESEILMNRRKPNNVLVNEQVDLETGLEHPKETFIKAKLWIGSSESHPIPKVKEQDHNHWDIKPIPNH